MPWWVWLGVCWLALAVAGPLIFGQVIRNRDRQKPEPPTKEQIDKAMQGLPTQRKKEGDLPGP